MMRPEATVVDVWLLRTRTWNLSLRTSTDAWVGVSPVMFGARWLGTKSLVREAT